MLRTFFFDIICILLSPLDLLVLQILGLFLLKVLCFPILISIEVWLALSIISPSHALIWVLQSIKSFMTTRTNIHLIAAKRILRYLNGTLQFGVFLQPGPLSLSTFSDSDWASDPFDKRSTTGYLVYLGYNPITRSAKKQDTISKSSTESEYKALASTAVELSWLCQVLKDLGIFLSHPPKLWCDNVNALAIVSNPVFHACTKHVEVD